MVQEYGAMDGISQEMGSSRTINTTTSESATQRKLSSSVPSSGSSNIFGRWQTQRQPQALGQHALSENKVNGVRLRRWAKIAVVCSAAAGAVMLALRAPDAGESLPGQPIIILSESDNSSSSSSRNGGETINTESSPGIVPLAFTALNFYHMRDEKPAQEYPWLEGVKLIEPHRETTLSVTDPRPGFVYRWEVLSPLHKDEVRLSSTGATSVVILTHLHDNVVVLEEVDGTHGYVSRRLEEIVAVKYVRREIRSLTDEERAELLDGMFQLWKTKVDGGQGRQIYGDDYADIWAINRLHFKATSAYECDRFHDGLGFLLSHTILTNTFESSLQLVNPKLTVPYWDFTIETSSSRSELFDPSKPTSRSPLLQESWFGGYDEEDYIVKDGRWAFTPIPKVHEANAENMDADVYSRLRVPWNVNARPYLVRGMGTLCQINTEDAFPWPTCENHYDLVTKYSDFYSWSWDAMHDPHGPVHAFLGGMIDCKDKYDSIGDLVGASVAEEMALASGLTIKDLYRKGLYTCSGPVDPAMTAEEVLSSGVCGCLGYDLTQGDDYKTVLAEITAVPSLIESFDDDTQRRVVELLCNEAVVEGDHQQASSSLDPTFWPIHPTIDRLWQYSVLTESVTNVHWPDADYSYTGPDGSNVTECISLYSATCEGHGGSDIFPFGMLDDEQDEFKVQTGIRWNTVRGNALTNREALQAFDPRVDALTYVYDNFKWEHCAEDGFDFGDAWGDTATISRTPVFKEGAPRFPLYSSLKKLVGGA